MSNKIGYILEKRGSKVSWLLQQLKNRGFDIKMTAVWNWANGRNDPRKEFRKDIADILGLSIEQVFEDEKVNSPCLSFGKYKGVPIKEFTGDGAMVRYLWWVRDNDNLWQGLDREEKEAILKIINR